MERTAYRTLRLNLPQLGDRLDRVENLLVPGTPDINFCADGVESWIELKTPIEPLRANTPLFGSNHRVSQNQQNWFWRQRYARGRCYFLLATNKRWILLGGQFADEINEMPLDKIIENALWCASRPIKEKEKWAALRMELMR